MLPRWCQSNFFVAWLCALGFAPELLAQPTDGPSGFTLAEALAAMSDGNPWIEASRARLRGAEHHVIAAGLWTNPQLSVLYTRSLGFTTFDPILGSAQVGVTQQLETSGLPSARRRVAAFERDAVRSDLGARSQELVFNAHEAFVALVAAHARLAVQRASLARVEQAASVIASRVAAGVAPHYDETRMALALATMRAALGEAEADVAVARTRLDVAVGPRADGLTGAPRYELSAQPALPSAEALLGAIGELRLDLRAAAQRASAAQASVDVAQRSVVPGVALYGGLAVGQGYGLNDERQVDVMVGLTVPLAVVNRGQGAIMATQAQAQASRREAEALGVEARQRVLGALREIEQRRRTEAAMEGVEANALRAVNEAESMYREGRVPIQALIDALVAARDVRLQQIQVSFAARSSEVGLWRAAGRPPAPR